MHAKSRLPWLAVACSATALLVGSAPCSASDATFDFRVDRFELHMTGSVPPGISDFTDEFDDQPSMERKWFTQYGTAFTADGFLHLASPGTELPNGFGVLPGTTLDLSLVGSVRQVSDQGGSFIARAYWEPDELAPGDFNHLSLNTIGFAGGSEVAGLAVTNMTRDGGVTKYTIVQHLIHFTGGVPEAPALASVTIEPSAITGQIVLELRFDDVENRLETAFSVDGGATFDHPFLPLRIFDGTSYGYFLLGADPQVGTVRPRPPAPPICASATVIGNAEILSRAGNGSTMSVNGLLGNASGLGRDYDPRRAGAQIRITDRSAPGTPILDLSSAMALRGGPGCGSRDGWRRVPKGFVYRNDTDALPPGCTPGSAGGVRRVWLRKTIHGRPKGSALGRRAVRFRIDLATARLPVPGARIATTIALGDAPQPGGAIPCGTFEVLCVASAAGVRCD